MVDADSARAVPEGKYVDVGNGVRIHYHEEGQGFPVIFIHGSGQGASGWSNFRHNARVLAEYQLRCLMPDVPGFGYSSKPDRKYPMEFMAGSLVAFADKLGLERFALVGNSMGGAAAIWIALNHPDRVERLVLMAPGGLEEREVYMQMKGIKTMVKIAFSGEAITRANMRQIFELQLHDPTLITDQIIEERYQLALLQPKGMIGRMRVPHQADRLSEIQCPTLAFWGQDDQFCPVSGATTIAQRVPGAKVMTLGQCGHWVMVEHATLFNRITADFLLGLYEETERG